MSMKKRLTGRQTGMGTTMRRYENENQGTGK